jgi:PAS domain S-box-containing protein
MNDKVNFLNFFFDSGKYSQQSINGRVVDLFPALICVYDFQSKKLIYINRKFRDYFAERLQDIQHSSDPLSSIAYEGDKELIKDALEKFRILSENDSHCFNCRFSDSRDSFRYFRTSGTILSKGNDEPGTVLFIAEDITDQIKTREELEARNLLFHETEASLEFGTWSWDPKTDRVEWTAGMYKLLGYEEGEVSHCLSTEFFLQHVLPEYQQEVRKAVNDKTVSDLEYCIRTKSGNVKIVSVKSKVVVGNDGDLQRIIGVTRDVTALRNFEQEQEKSVRELNRSNKELEEFAYVASHDLQEPLRKISMFSERLKVKFENVVDKEGQMFLNRIQASADNMKGLIDNLLEFSRVNRNERTFSELNLEEVLNTVISNLELKIEETGTKIQVSLLPTVQAVRSEMEQVFANLLSNAIKFRRNSVTPEIRVTARKASRAEKSKHSLRSGVPYFVIEVSDNGIGFEEQYTEQIFQIFHRLHGKSEYPGSGIGLSICKKILDNHKGVIFAKSVPESGSTFTVIIPEKQY